MFEEILVKKVKEKKEKRTNIYKVVTAINTEPKDPDSTPTLRTHFVRAKTKQGAANIAKEHAVSITCTSALATQDDLLGVAALAVLVEAAG